MPVKKAKAGYIACPTRQAACAQIIHLKKAWDGELWKKGFKMTLFHNTGREIRRVAATIVNAVVPKKWTM